MVSLAEDVSAGNAGVADKRLHAAAFEPAWLPGRWWFQQGLYMFNENKKICLTP
jgi:hypothetical protein